MVNVTVTATVIIVLTATAIVTAIVTVILHSNSKINSMFFNNPPPEASPPKGVTPSPLIPDTSHFTIIFLSTAPAPSDATNFPSMIPTQPALVIAPNLIDKFTPRKSPTLIYVAESHPAAPRLPKNYPLPASRPTNIGRASPS